MQSGNAQENSSQTCVSISRSTEVIAVDVQFSCGSHPKRRKLLFQTATDSFQDNTWELKQCIIKPVGLESPCTHRSECLCSNNCWDFTLLCLIHPDLLDTNPPEYGIKNASKRNLKCLVFVSDQALLTALILLFACTSLVMTHCGSEASSERVHQRSDISPKSSAVEPLLSLLSTTSVVNWQFGMISLEAS